VASVSIRTERTNHYSLSNISGSEGKNVMILAEYLFTLILNPCTDHINIYCIQVDNITQLILVLSYYIEW